MTATDAVTSVSPDVVDTGVLSDYSLVLLYDLGRHGATVSLVDVDEMAVIDSSTSSVVGGDVFDHIVLDHIVDKGILERPAEGSDDTDVMVFCRRVKESLSSATVARTPGGGATLITRDEFETAVRPLLDGSLDAAASLLDGERELDAVVLIGGGAVIPVLSIAAAEKFGVPVLTAMDSKKPRESSIAPPPDPVDEPVYFPENQYYDDAPVNPVHVDPIQVDPVRVDVVSVGGDPVPDPRRSRVPVAIVIAVSCAIMAGAAAWTFTSMPAPMDPAPANSSTVVPTATQAPVGSRGIPRPSTVTTTVDPFADETDTGDGSFSSNDGF